MRSAKEVREFQLEMLRVQLRHEERMTWFSALITSVIALTIFFLSLVVLGLQLSSQLAISGGTELTARIINFLIFYGGWGALIMAIAFSTIIIGYPRLSKKKDEEIKNIRKRFIEHL